ncbi:hypothetical protein [Salinisphaera sp. Q1T1-3]|uniref:hypothetical protein n=1 Tax=Salinisphaera sp. Q1T1-3 TaxID=2321229 RepID=UPI000E7617E6|nr:hypothetical protein [Salinisphaera sp. Q1T1-3]RJS94462.1 hypothetical protein D3260_05045 [Salinisphaera sp. Q1T1-3]
MTDSNPATRAAAARHPAFESLVADTRGLRARLAHALAIEYDWRYHDGPEWAARYWQAFGDLAVDLADAAESPRYQRVLERTDWRTLSSAEADDVRTIFRGLIALVDPRVVPAARDDVRADLWPKILRAYRAGDRGGLVAAWSEVRALVRSPALPDDVVALRAEHDRLSAAAAAADRRLAEMSQTFPFNMRDRLADPDWVRRQRQALRQVRVFIEPPVGTREVERVS